MKTNCWMVLGAMLATSAIAQNNTNTLPEIPAPATSVTSEVTPAPAAAAPAVEPKAAPAKPAKRPVVRHAIKEPKVSLVPGPAQVAVSNLLVRGQAGLKGEVVAHLFKGDAVTVLDQINLGKHTPDEPAQWAKIALPSTVHVWVSAKYIDSASKVVTTKRLNLRAGPGENFSVLGTIERGTPVNELETKGKWIKIEAPTNAYAFTAAMYLNQTEPPPPEVAATPAPAPTPVPEVQPIITTPPPAETPAPVTPPPAPTPAPAMVAAEANVPPPPRIVSHEGVVRRVGSIIAPTEYELYDPSTDKNINYLYPTIGTLDLSKYVSSRVIVTGEEGLAARWKDVPVLTVESIRVIQTNAVPRVIYHTPRQSQAH